MTRELIKYIFILLHIINKHIYVCTYFVWQYIMQFSENTSDARIEMKVTAVVFLYQFIIFQN